MRVTVSAHSAMIANQEARRGIPFSDGGLRLDPITVDSGRRRPRVANDGKARRSGTPLVYRIRPGVHARADAWGVDERMRTLAHISDLHFGRVDARVVEGLLADLVHAQPDLVVISGDLVQRARRGHFRDARAFLDRLPFRYLVVPGNHDIPVFNLFKRFSDPYRLYRRNISQDLSPFHIDSEIAILGLNTARTFVFDFSQGRISQAQVSRIREVFSGLPEHLFKIVFTHHPFLPPPDEPGRRLVGRARLALPVLETCGIDLMLAGHFHKAYSGDLARFYPGIGRSILVAQASTATSTRLRREANAYNLIRIERDAVRIDVRAWTSERFDTTETTLYQRDGSRWRKDA